MLVHGRLAARRHSLALEHADAFIFGNDLVGRRGDLDWVLRAGGNSDEGERDTGNETSLMRPPERVGEQERR